MPKTSRLEHVSNELNLLKKKHYDSFQQNKKKQMDAYEKILKFIKKQVKDHKLTDKQVEQLYSSLFSTLTRFIHSAYNTLKLVLTDVEAYLTLRKTPTIMSETLFPKVVKTLVDDELALSNINFDLQNYKIVDLCRIGARLFQECAFTSVIKFQKVFEFCKQLSKMYNCVPYHNFTHAMNVCLMFYNCYNDAKLNRYIDDFEVFFALIACLGHDVNHQGLNNLYYSKTKAQRALRYGYQAILQKMHLSKYMQFLQQTNISLFKNLTKAQTQRAKIIITKAILATDMAYHFKISDMMKQKVSAANLSKQGVKTPLAQLFGIKQNKSEDRQFLIEVFVHACDIGNPCLSYDNYMHWANLICLQFNQQTIRQQQNQIQVTPFLKYTTISNFYRTQISFSNNVVYPLWLQITTLFPQLTPLKLQIISNSKKVEEFAKKKSQQSKKNIKRK